MTIVKECLFTMNDGEYVNFFKPVYAARTDVDTIDGQWLPVGRKGRNLHGDTSTIY